MPSRLRIAGWSAKGLRCPDHSLDFTTGDTSVNRISLIQMPNGTGKTTTLELLRAALSGSALSQKWQPDFVRSFQKKSTKPEHGRFQLALLHNENRLTITLEFDFEEGSIKYATTGAAGLGSGFEPPRALQQFMKPDFVRFFVFDGELAAHLLDKNFTDAQRAIEILFQLNLFSQIKTRVNDLWEEAVQTKDASESRGLTRRRNRLRRLRARIRKLTKEFDRLERTRDALSAKLLTKRERFEQDLNALKSFEDQLQDSTREFQQAGHRVDTLRQSALERIRSPQALSVSCARELRHLRRNLDRVKLPESAAREFFEELAQESSCVCGRSLDSNTRAEIRTRAKQYFGSDDVALLNALKSDISDMIGPSDDSQSLELEDLLAELSRAVRYEEQCRDDVALIESQAIEGNPRLERAREEINTLEADLGQIQIDLENYSNPSDKSGDDDTFGIDVLKARERQAAEKLAEITRTLELKMKTETLIHILGSAQESAMNMLSSHICKQANQRIESLMPDNPISVDRIDRCLVLQGQEQGSAGETLSIAYGFLSTLFNRSEHELPFVVDSPAGPIDLSIRPNIASLIPKLTSQFIAFTISSERDGFVGPLDRAANGDVQYFTLFKPGSATYGSSQIREYGPTEAGDGVCIQGAEFFNDFQIEKEET